MVDPAVFLFVLLTHSGVVREYGVCKGQNREDHDCKFNQSIESDELLHKPGADKEVLFQNKRNVRELYRKDNRKNRSFIFDICRHFILKCEAVS